MVRTTRKLGRGSGETKTGMGLTKTNGKKLKKPEQKHTSQAQRNRKRTKQAGPGGKKWELGPGGKKRYWAWGSYVKPTERINHFKNSKRITCRKQKKKRKVRGHWGGAVAAVWEKGAGRGRTEFGEL